MVAMRWIAGTLAVATIGACVIDTRPPPSTGPTYVPGPTPTATESSAPAPGATTPPPVTAPPTTPGTATTAPPPVTPPPPPPPPVTPPPPPATTGTTAPATCPRPGALPPPCSTAECAQRAQAINDEGKRLWQGNADLAGASAKFMEAYGLVRSPTFAFNLCYAQHQLAEFVCARWACQQVTGDAAAPAPLIDKAKVVLDDIRRRIGDP